MRRAWKSVTAAQSIAATASLLGAVACAAALTGAARQDALTREIADAWPIGLSLGFLALAPVAGLSFAEIGAHLLTGAAILLLGFALFALGWMGGADGKLAAACALILGPAATPHFLALTAILGGALALAILAFRAAPLPRALNRRRWARLLHRKGVGAPYGVALALAGALALPQSPLMAIAAP
jgi:prepilin peptidase CpaA